MKKFSSLVILISFLIFTVSPQASASSLQNFTITRFVQNYNLIKNSDGTSTAKIDEYITAYFPVLNQNHGILRALPNSYDGISLKLSEISVDNAKYLQTEPPTSWSYTTYRENNNKVLKIGDPNTFVNGVQYYHISYTMQNVVRDFGDHQELYINVNGNDWEQQFYSVESIITTDNQVAATVQNQVCFTGSLRSTESACEGFQGMQNSTQTVFTTNTTRTLNAGENLSVALWMPHGTFTVIGLSTTQKIINKLFIVGSFAVLFVPIIVLIVLFRRWLKNGRDKKSKGTIVAQYEPLKDLEILASGVILKQTSTPTAITAGIIDLAIRGYLRIIDDEAGGLNYEYTLEKLKDYGELPKNQQLIMNALFSEGNSIKLSKLKNKLSKNAKEIQKLVDSKMVSEGYYAVEPSKQRSNYRSAGIAILIFGSFMAWFGLAIVGSGSNPLLAFSGISAVASGLLIILFGLIMPARTVKGSEANDYLLGLKEYIKLAEKDRITFHQSLKTAERKKIDINNPAQKIHLYETLLPYAILFGLENSWSKGFADLYTEPPTWYSGNSTAWNAVYFSSAISGFSTASSASFSSASGSGGGGFGGGGSGGGGGGGGGGGW